MEYQTLEKIDISRIHQAFLQAFSDYQVSVGMPLEAFEMMLKRNGFVSGLSVGAFADGELVGFVLNGARNWEGEKTIYDLGTGVIPAFRRKGITSSVLELVRNLCIENNIGRYQLEVIQDNENAVLLYKKQGFQICRTLNCYRMECKERESRENMAWKLLHPEKLSEEQWTVLKSFWDYPPSWQNSVDSVCAISKSFFYTLAEIDGELIGYGVVSKGGDLVQLAVKPEYRQMGVATEILYDLQRQAQKQKMTALNVDGRDIASDAFLRKMGFDVFVKQYEMENKIVLHI